MELNEEKLEKALAKRALEISGGSHQDLERFCWMAVHEYRHSALPTEYDIREIDEDLYLAVLNIARSFNL